MEAFDQDTENHDLAIPPDGGWGWIVVAASAMCNLLTEGIFYSFPLIVLELIQVFHHPVVQVVSIYSVFGGFILMADSLANQCIDRMGFNAVRPLMIVAALLGSLALAASSFVDCVNYLFVTVGMVAGLSFGVVYTSSLKAINFYFEQKKMVANRISVCCSALGVSVCAPLTAFLLDNYGWRGAILLQSGIYLNCAVFALLVRPIDTINMWRRRANAKVPAVKGTPLMQRIKRDRDRKLGILIANSSSAIQESSHRSASSSEAFYSCQELHIPSRSPSVQNDVKVWPKEQEIGTGRMTSVSIIDFSEESHEGIIHCAQFRSPSFILLCISSFILCLGYLTPYIFIPSIRTRFQ